MRRQALLAALVIASVLVAGEVVRAQTCQPLPRSVDMARWEASFRTSLISTGGALLAGAFLTPFGLPYLFLMFPRWLAWSLGLGLRCVAPASVLAIIGGGLGSLVTFDAGRQVLTPLSGLSLTYFECATRPGITFTQPGLFLGFGAGAPLAAQPLLVMSLLTASPILGGLFAGFGHWLLRFRAPIGQVRK